LLIKRNLIPMSVAALVAGITGLIIISVMGNGLF
jgi:hypothetical protein